eukprot:CAMPEP_0197643330 /NCGR_PEP_ID=MMETSP1338-20131121/16687_1 /TAXON_ID=43686 ORGANISM="Pelagodinium beii, Strain RCC1491" /NCGR_SAMPLE_ID=MMETSP1338 /ASSEMBLY_ACC=CAM_ASM_000754 /LENGTH=123 /DNA_ID=CAMNT_0043216575 /DNA_START=35 /DNA_END=407 /DNA_ORIENTATION=-
MKCYLCELIWLLYAGRIHADGPSEDYTEQTTATTTTVATTSGAAWEPTTTAFDCTDDEDYWDTNHGDGTSGCNKARNGGTPIADSPQWCIISDWGSYAEEALLHCPLAAIHVQGCLTTAKEHT